MAGLPKLPGYSFNDPTLSKFHLSQTFNMCNGYKLPKTEFAGIGGRELGSNSVKYLENKDPVRYDPSLTYGRTRSKALPRFSPHYALYDKKCLTFKAFFKQSVVESPDEFYRVRQVNIIYFLEDDSITVMEPRIPNSGLEQGRLIRRGKIPKYEDGTFYHWKDLQVGKDLPIYGIVFHTVDCDLFTREFMASQGLTMGEPEEMPVDPYMQNRRLLSVPHITKTPPADDKLRRFLEYDGKVLKFKAVWDDRENEYGDLMKFEIYYFLSDDTVTVKNVLMKNSGRDPYAVLLRKTKLPKIYTDTPVTYPAIYLEKSENEVIEYYQPKDFLVGSTIFVLGRDMLLYDCDKFTRDYFKNALCIEQKPEIDITEEEDKETSLPERPVPPHDGLGSLEDSLQNTLTFLPKPPKKDVIRQIFNANKYLRYEMKMDSVHPEDTIRRFILSYSLADGTLKIVEPPIRNSGIIGGMYLRSSLVPKPGSDPLNPTLYTPVDFYIGAIITVYGQRFVIIGADLYVYRYMQQNVGKFPCEVIENMRNYMFNKGLLKGDVDDLIKEELDAIKKHSEGKAEERENIIEECMKRLKVQINNPEFDKYEKELRAKILQEYENSLIHVKKIPPHGILPVNKECAYPIHVGDKPSIECTEEIQAKYAAYAPKHIDTPEEVTAKYYAGVLKHQQDICDGRYPIECVEPPNEADEGICQKSSEEPVRKHIMVSPPDIPPDACNVKMVRFADQTDRCAKEVDNLSGQKDPKTTCDCTDYKPGCN